MPGYPPTDPALRSAMLADLEAQRIALSRLVRRLETVMHSALVVDRHWRGPASIAFCLAFGSIRHEAQRVVDAVTHATQLTEAALYELEHGV
jgi:hypothetical protein